MKMVKLSVRRLVERLEKERTTGLAAEMAFWVFLSVLPLGAVVGFVAARLAVTERLPIREALIALPPEARDALFDQLTRVAAWQGDAVGPVSALVFLWLASSGLHAVFDALDIQNRWDRPWWKKRVRALAGCILLSLGFGALGLLVTGIAWVGSLLGVSAPSLAGLPGLPRGIGDAALRIGAGVFIAFGLVAFVYWLGYPREMRGRLPIVPGATFVVVFDGLLAFVYHVYLARMGMGDAYRAGLAVVAVTLTALYLLSLALLIGAEINQLWWLRRRARRWRARSAMP